MTDRIFLGATIYGLAFAIALIVLTFLRLL